jgi:KDO2-lipid IV(A) lauroyltransferase
LDIDQLIFTISMVQALTFYLVYPFIYLVASLPFGALYRLSDFFYHILRISGYRQDVIANNLRNAFPEKSDKEIRSLTESYNRYLCDLTLETLKTLTMTEKEARERCTFQQQPWLEELYKERRSFIIVMGHHGNWEWAGPSFTLNTPFQLVVIYRPLSNPYFDAMMVRARTKFGTRISPVNLTLRDMIANRGIVSATAFIADQTAPADKGYWMTFLNQDTAVFTGYEKLAVKFNYPVVYIHARRVRRGYYSIELELLFENPSATSEHEISRAFMLRLEKDIVRDPAPWLWSHRRWKHRRQPVPAQQTTS